MKLIVGLGNPGMQYENNRHNAGFMALRHLANRYKLEFNKAQCQARTAGGQIMQQEVLLARPQTYMNLSGQAVKKLADKYHVAIADIIVIHDDLDLPTGKIRLKKGGGTGGHNGLESINAELGNASYIRVKIGISRPQYSGQVRDYVLSNFPAEERQMIDTLLPTISDAVTEIIRTDILTAANRYNEDAEEKRARAEAKEARRLLKEEQKALLEEKTKPQAAQQDILALDLSLDKTRVISNNQEKETD